MGLIDVGAWGVGQIYEPLSGRTLATDDIMQAQAWAPACLRDLLTEANSEPHGLDQPLSFLPRSRRALQDPHLLMHTEVYVLMGRSKWCTQGSGCAMLIAFGV